LTSVVFED